MGLLESLLGQQDNNPIMQLEHFGLDSGQMQNVVGQLAPALSSGLMHHTEQHGLSSLAGLMQPDDHAQYTQNPQLLQQPQAVDTGNNILGKLFGSKDISSQVADTTAQNTGVSSDIIKKMLPVLAIIAVSALHKQTQQSSMQNTTNAQQSESLLGELKQFLGGGQQSSIASDVMGMLRQRSA